MIHTHEKKLIYFTLAILGLFLLIHALIVFPYYRKIQTVNQRIFELRQDLETRYAKSRSYHKSQLNLASAKQLTAKLQPLFVKKGQEIKFITAWETLAEKMDVKQDLILSPQTVKIADGLSILNLQISAKGEFKNLIAFLEALEKNEFLVVIDEITFSRDTSAILTVDLKAKTYVQD